MRSSVFFTSCLFFVANAFAAEGEKPVSSRITGAKVFLAGAQVSRSASTTVPVGSSLLVFTGLSQEVDPQSIQVTGKAVIRS